MTKHKITKYVYKKLLDLLKIIKSLINLIKTNLFSKKYKICDLFDYAVENNCIIPLSYNLNVNNYENVENYSKYFITLENAYVFSDCDAFCVKSNFLYRIPTLSNDFVIKNYPILKTYTSNKVRIYIDKKKNTNLDKAISLVKMWSTNYFHFTFEVLAKLTDINRISCYDDWPILIDESILNDKRAIDFLNYINNKKREIVYVNKNNPIKVGHLLVPPCYCHTVSQNEGYTLIEKRAYNFLRECILSHITLNKNFKKVFIIRGNDNRLLNESTLIKILSEKKFEIFNPDKYDFLTEIQVFSSADVIVSCAGAASTNFIYCKKSAEIYGIVPSKYDSFCFDCFRKLGINIKCLEADLIEDGVTFNASKFRLDPSILSEIYS